MKRHIVKAVILAICVGVFFGINFLGNHGDINFSRIVTEYSFKYYRFSYTDIIYMTTRMLPYFLFIFMFGTYIYRHFMVAGVYVFSRCEKRLKWIVAEVSKLFLFCIIFISVIPLSGTAVACITNKPVIEAADVEIYLYYVAIYSLWIFMCTLTANVLAIKLGGMSGFSIVIGALCVFMALLALWDSDNVLSLENEYREIADRNAFLLKWNPVSHLVMTWHSSIKETVNMRIDLLGIDFSLICSTIVMAGLSVTAAAASTIYLNRADLIIIVGREEN